MNIQNNPNKEKALNKTLVKKSDGIVNAQALKAKQLIDEFNIWLIERGISEQIEVSGPVSFSKIEKAEKALGIKLPPSYVDFVTRYGTFEIDGDLTGRGSGNYTSFFTPAFMLEKTSELRNEFEKYYEDDSEDRRIVSDGLLFCADPMDEFYYVFVISSADESGEMNVRRFDYDDLGNNDPWFKGDLTFYSAIEEIIGLVQKNILKEESEQDY